MSELLFEVFCEEIPAGMQAKAAKDLEAALVKALGEAGLKAESTTALVGARRLSVVMTGLPAKADDVREERKGPRVGAPEKALQGFLRGAGLDSTDSCEQREDKKGAFWVAIIDKPGRQTTEVVAEAIPAILQNFHWPKSMKIGEGEKQQRWVRPIQRLLCVFDGEVVPFKVFGLETSNITEGHRVHGRGPFTVTGFADYKAQLEGEGHVLLDAQDRKRMIMDSATKACRDAGLELVEDQGLLNEVCGLVEWPVPVLGEMDPDFLDLPPEVITLTMKTHQKYFAVRDPKTNKLSAHFVTVANQTAPDGGKAIAAGNSRVLSARLADARHFWDNDRKTPLFSPDGDRLDMLSQLSKVTFHEKLGTVRQRIDRMQNYGSWIADRLGVDRELVMRGILLCKADLVSEMVYEFPELQGAMGSYYAIEQGEHPEVSVAIGDHYRPQGPSDSIPSNDVAAVVALTDKIEVLTSFWSIGEKPTGSKDPFALRRAALGVIRILLERGYRLSLGKLIADATHYLSDDVLSSTPLDVNSDLLSFFADRLKVHLRDEGIRHDVIDAVFALGDDDLVRVTKKARALQGFLDAEDGTALLAGYKRASNILNKTEDMPEGAHDAGAAVEAAETALMRALAQAGPKAQAALEAEDFTAAMAALAMLRAPIDAFFESVTVNSDDALLRRNRLLLLSDIRAAIHAVADFGRIEG